MDNSIGKPLQLASGAFYYGHRPQASEPRSNFYAFMARFVRARSAAAEVGQGGLVTTTDGVTELRVYGAIGSGFGVGPKDVARAIDEHDIQRVRLNSPGGDVFDGV